jgi:hypothetical protein
MQPRGVRRVACGAWLAARDGGVRRVAWGAWRGARGVRRVVCGAWRVACGVGRVACGAWRAARGVRRVAWGAWRGDRGVGRVAWGAWLAARSLRRVAWGAWFFVTCCARGTPDALPCCIVSLGTNLKCVFTLARLGKLALPSWSIINGWIGAAPAAQRGMYGSPSSGHWACW